MSQLPAPGSWPSGAVVPGSSLVQGLAQDLKQQQALAQAAAAAAARDAAANAMPLGAIPIHRGGAVDLGGTSMGIPLLSSSAGILSTSAGAASAAAAAAAGPIGVFTGLPNPHRAAILARYRAKRAARIAAISSGEKKIRYQCRKTLADARPRVKGRFAKGRDLVRWPILTGPRADHAGLSTVAAVPGEGEGAKPEDAAAGAAPRAATSHSSEDTGSGGAQEASGRRQTSRQAARQQAQQQAQQQRRQQQQSAALRPSSRGASGGLGRMKVTMSAVDLQSLVSQDELPGPDLVNELPAPRPVPQRKPSAKSQQQKAPRAPPAQQQQKAGSRATGPAMAAPLGPGFRAPAELMGDEDDLDLMVGTVCRASTCYF